MEFSFFEIMNFRGIAEAKIDIAKRPRSRIVTLVGLNESGKTTILEAINHLAPSAETLDELEIPGQKIKDIHSLIPISKRSNFNENIKFKFELTLDETDIKTIYDRAVARHQITLSDIPNRITVTRTIAFTNSKHNPDQSKTVWDWRPTKTEKVGKKTRTLRVSGEQWGSIVKIAREMFPRIIYFPTFLFEFPEKIFLEATEANKEKHEFYQKVLQDVLDTCIPDATIQQHIVERAKSSDASEKINLEAVTLKMGRKITEVVFGAWSDIFKQQLTGKSIRLATEIDQASGKVCMLVKLEDTDGYFKLSERSLGFRWFFTFLLLTHFRGFRSSDKNGVVFLFDEPASNLHATAQAQLLKSFEALQARCSVVYTTHSHYMIEPRWLESTYVVRNTGLSLGQEDQFTVNNTNIVASKYREFASKHPDQTDYFKPILDVLDYQPSRLDNLPSIVMLEGKTDFYGLEFLSSYSNQKTRINWMPGTGSGSLTTAIQLYIAWGRPFIALLDDDHEGKVQKARYIELFGKLAEGCCFTLGDIHNSLSGAKIETIFDQHGDGLNIIRSLYPDETKSSKKLLNRAIQECLLTSSKPPLSEECLGSFQLIAEFIQSKLNDPAV
ncbi:MAG: ATP-dependent nuclease [Hydrogenophaga sp.]|jgi:AAA15 family ATPase/GTPase|uniref:ATP-dependent nuclease n=1 Tax=Hydrogenophaga sp. TaxID=1904254 RepID=UPI0040373370